MKLVREIPFFLIPGSWKRFLEFVKKMKEAGEYGGSVATFFPELDNFLSINWVIDNT
jgi:hypothetical protein